MHELGMRERHLMPKNESFSSYLKELKLRKCSDIWAINKTHNRLLAHELKNAFYAFKFRAQLTSYIYFLGWQNRQIRTSLDLKTI
jgi:hypothetical protein